MPAVVLERQRFIKDPDYVMKTHSIRGKRTRQQIRNLLALEVAKRLLVVPFASFIHW